MTKQAGEKGVVLLSGGNPQIPKGDGEAPVRAYIAAMPGQYVKLTSFNGASLKPLPPGGAEKSGQGRWIDIHEGEDIDEAQLTDWVKQAASLPGWDFGQTS